ncbi:hypothetical protein T439DRAFT_324395 [Meredithblackwellia eburnea MCA 4105]
MSMKQTKGQLNPELKSIHMAPYQKSSAHWLEQLEHARKRRLQAQTSNSNCKSNLNNHLAYATAQPLSTFDRQTAETEAGDLSGTELAHITTYTPISCYLFEDSPHGGETRSDCEHIAALFGGLRRATIVTVAQILLRLGVESDDWTQNSPSIPESLFIDVQRCLLKKGKKKRRAKGDYNWLNALADETGTENGIIMSYFSARRELPRREAIEQDRYFGGGLFHAGADEINWNDLVAPMEVTPAALSAAWDILGDVQLQRIVMHAVTLLQKHPFRDFALGISIHRDDIILALLDHEQLQLARLPHSFTHDGISRTSALLSVLRSRSVFELGLSPLFGFDVNSTNFSRGNVQPSRFYIPSPHISPCFTTPLFPAVDSFALGEIIASPSQNPFGRSTLVVQLHLPPTEYTQPHSDDFPPNSSAPVLLKVQWVDNKRTGNEVAAYDFLRTASPHPDSLPVPKLLTAFTNPRSFYSPTVSTLTTSDIVPRHLEILVMRGKKGVRRLSELPGPASLLRAAHQLVVAICHTHWIGIMNKDISSGNVLANADGDLHWIDWETAELVGAPWSDDRIGTRDTMCVDALRGNPTTIALSMSSNRQSTCFGRKFASLSPGRRAGRASTGGREISCGISQAQPMVLARLGLWSELGTQDILEIIREHDERLGGVMEDIAGRKELGPNRKREVTGRQSRAQVEAEWLENILQRSISSAKDTW